MKKIGYKTLDQQCKTTLVCQMKQTHHGKERMLAITEYISGLLESWAHQRSVRTVEAHQNVSMNGQASVIPMSATYLNGFDYVPSVTGSLMLNYKK